MENGMMLADGDHPSRDWSAVPGELLACIRGRLLPADFARFAAVCAAWRRPAPSTPLPQLPWLMVPPSSSSSSSSPGEVPTCCFFSPSEGRTYRVSVPELRGTRCVGSCEGWVASFDGATAEMSLVNPLTRDRIPLPSPLSCLPRVAAARDGEGRIVQYRFFVDDRYPPAAYTIDDVHGLVKKVLMSSAPTDDAVCKLAATFCCCRPPAFVAVGGEKWAVAAASAALGGGGALVDIVYHDGDGKFYGLNFDNRVFRWHAADDVEFLELHCRPAPDFPRRSYRYAKHLAVHRPTGDLLLVFVDCLIMRSLQYTLEGRVQKMGAVKAFGCSQFWRKNKSNCLSGNAVKAFRYKGDKGSAGAWLRVESLSGCSLFLGRNQPICLSAQDIPDLRADCIFIINHGLSAIGRERHRTQMWVYDLKEGVMEPFCPSEWHKCYEEPFWFTPNLS